jgi:hypothetical protein
LNWTRRKKTWRSGKNKGIMVPTLFVSESGVSEQIDQMEIRYLSNPDGQVYFALLSDWADADRETLPGDERLLNVATNPVTALNGKHGGHRFFLFHRKRLWNPSEVKRRSGPSSPMPCSAKATRRANCRT